MRAERTDSGFPRVSDHGTKKTEKSTEEDRQIKNLQNNNIQTGIETHGQMLRVTKRLSDGNELGI